MSGRWGSEEKSMSTELSMLSRYPPSHEDVLPCCCIMRCEKVLTGLGACRARGGVCRWAVHISGCWLVSVCFGRGAKVECNRWPRRTCWALEQHGNCLIVRELRQTRLCVHACAGDNVAASQVWVRVRQHLGEQYLLLSLSLSAMQKCFIAPAACHRTGYRSNRACLQRHPSRPNMQLLGMY